MIEPKLQTVDMMLNMGPQHPATHGLFRMVLTVDGERIVDCQPHLGYLHRGVEKLSENLPYEHVLTLLDRSDYVCAFNNEWPYVIALEKLMGVSVPERAEYIRIIMAELNRIANHMLFYGSFGADAGALTPFLYAFREREYIQSVFEAVSGARMMHNYFRVGGVREDVPPDFERRMAELIPKLRRGIEECDELLSRNEVLIARTRGVGIISAEDAMDYGMSGPSLRASGPAIDLRKTEPYSVYDQFDFDIPVGQRGDTYDRYILRIEEMRQSLRIVEQALEKMPAGRIRARVPRIVRPRPGEAYARCENPRGDFGVYVVAMGGDRAYRMKVRSPAFCNLMALPHLLRGSYVADVVLILGSLDICLGEVDR